MLVVDSRLPARHAGAAPRLTDALAMARVFQSAHMDFHKMIPSW